MKTPKVLVLLSLTIIGFFSKPDKLYASKIILKKFSASLNNSLHLENKRITSKKETAKDGAFKYLIISMEFYVKLAKKDKEIRIDGRNTFLNDSNGIKYKCVGVCFPNKAKRYSYSSIYNTFDKDDQKKLYCFYLAFCVDPNESEFTLHMDNLKKKFKVKKAKKDNVSSLISYATFKLKKARVIKSVSKTTWLGRVGKETLNGQDTFKATKGNKLVVITFNIAPKKHFHNYETNQFVLPAIVITDKNSTGIFLGLLDKKDQLSTHSLTIYKQKKKWPTEQVKAVFSVPKEMQTFTIKAFGKKLLSGTIK